jgi:hypothetical protein
MGLIRSPETSVSNHPTPRNNPEDGRIQNSTQFYGQAFKGFLRHQKDVTQSVQCTYSDNLCNALCNALTVTQFVQCTYRDTICAMHLPCTSTFEQPSHLQKKNSLKDIHISSVNCVTQFLNGLRFPELCETL